MKSIKKPTLKLGPRWGQVPRLFVFLMLLGSIAGAIIVRNGKRTSENTGGKIERTDSSGVTTGIQYKHSGVTTDLADIAAVNALTLSAGDTIAFPKGNTFYGQINISQSGSSSHPIVITSYGSGAKPIISGAIQTLGTWVERGTFYAVRAGGTVYDLLCDGKHQIPSRYPNLDASPSFLRITDTASVGVHRALHSTQLNQATDYWQGCKIRLRETHGYRYGTMIVDSSSGDHVVYTAATYSPSYDPEVGYSFTLDGKLAELDQPGEWYYDSSKDTLYFWAPGSVNPSTLNVEAITANYGIKDSAKSYITVDGLEFRATRYAGMYFTGASSSITIQNCAVRGVYGDGICTGAGPVTNILCDADSVSDVCGNGISLYHYGKVSNCVVQRVAMQRGLGSEPPVSNELLHMAIGIGVLTMNADSAGFVTNCRVDSTGYIGIEADTVTNNYVTNALLTLNDGGGIYTYCANPVYGHNSPPAFIDHNIVIGVYGDTLGARQEALIINGLVNGIYLDGFTHNARVTNNFVANVRDCGIFVQEMNNHDTITNNTVYNASQFNQEVNMEFGAIGIWNNLTYASDPEHILDADTVLVFDIPYNNPLQIYDRNSNEDMPVTSNHNVYVMPTISGTVVRWPHYDFVGYTLPEWVAAVHQDSASTVIAYDICTYLINPTGSPLAVSPAVLKAWRTLAGAEIGSSVTLPGHSSLVLIASDTNGVLTFPVPFLMRLF